MLHRRLAWVAGAPFLFLGASAHADQKGEALVKKSIAYLSSLKSIQANLEGSAVAMRLDGYFKAQKPNKARLVMRVSGGSKETMTIVSNGKAQYMHAASMNLFQKETPPKQGLFNNADQPKPVALFFEPQLFKSLGEPIAIAPKTRRGQTYAGVRFAKDDLRLYFDSAGLVVGEESKGEDSAGTIWLYNVKTNLSFAAKEFAFMPPKGAKNMEEAGVGDDYEKRLVAVGKPAPTFTLKTPQGGQVSLAKLAKESKVVLVNFWFYG